MQPTIYTGPYVHGPDLQDETFNRSRPSFKQAATEIWRHFKLRPTSNLPSRASRNLRALKILMGLFLVSTTMAVVSGMKVPVIVGLGAVTVLATLGMLGIAFETALGDYRRQLAAVYPRRVLSPLAFKLTDSVRLDALLAIPDDHDDKWNSLLLEAVHPDDLRADDVLLVEAGQFIHANGFILKGTAIVDEAAVTGESNAVVREACGFREVMRDSLLIMGKLLVQVAPGPPEWWSDTAAAWHLPHVRSGSRNVQFALHGSKLLD